MIKMAELQDLDKLEEQSIFILREAKAKFKNLAGLWSMGKDSTVMLALARKAFFGRVPFPVIHIDNGIDFPETYEYRKKLADEWNLNLIVEKSVIRDDVSGIKCCGSNKTDALKKVLDEKQFDGVIVSIRRDEHGIRAKERAFCFPTGTPVYGEQIKTIDEIDNGDGVYTHLGSQRKVEDVFSSRYKGRLLRIHTSYNIPFQVTPNHTMFAKVPGDGNKRASLHLTGYGGVTREVSPMLKGRWKNAWVSAGELRAGDYLYIPKLPKKPQDGIKTLQFVPIIDIIGEQKGLKKIGRQYYWKSTHSSTPRMRASLPLSPEMLRVLGYYIAEGSSNLTRNQVSFAFHIKEGEYKEDVLETMKDTFGLDGGVRKKGNSVEITISSKILALLFSKLCGKGARNKHLPHFFTRLSRDQLRELIKGCWRGDGSGERYSTMSQRLAQELKLGMLRLGILCSIKKHKDPRYHLTVAGCSKKRFSELFGIECRIPYDDEKRNAREIKELHASELSKCDYGKARSGGFWIPIRKIESVPYDGKVYDLKVEGHSSYLVNGMAVHNSPRDKDFKWDYENQPPEVWDFTTKFEDSSHVRIHPLLQWNEIDTWRYVKRENIQINPLYFSRNGKRFRSLGCTECTVSIESEAKTIDDIIEELKTTDIAERSGRMQDKEKENVMQRLRALGYM